MIRVRRAAAVLAIAACSGSSTRTASAPSGGPAAPALAPAREAGAAPEPAPASAPGQLAPVAAAPGPAAPPASAAPAASAPGVKVTLADVGLEADSLDRTADPCIDFYQFACGGWIQNNPIPADLARWGRRSQLDEHNKAAIKTLLEDAAKPSAGTAAATKKLGAYYASCMDEPRIERAGTAAFAALLARTRGVKDARTWLAAVIELHKLGIYVVWDNHVAADLKNSTTNLTYLDAAGLGLPDRDYYVKLELRDKLDGYRAQVGKLLALVPGAGALDPADVVAIETELARLTKTAVERRDVPAAYNPTDAKALGRQVKSVDWAAYWKGLGTAPSAKIIVGTPRLFAALDKLRAKFKPAQWASYFTYHLVQDLAFAMPRQLDDAAFELRKLVTGVEQQRERSKRCIERTSEALGELLGQAYVASYFPGSSKQSATRLVDALVRAMTDDIAGLDWMAGATKQIAIAKLERTVRMIGYPERWKAYDFDVKPDDFAGNALRAAAFEVRRELARAGKPVDRGEWLMNAYQVDAYYSPSANNTALPAGILQPPYFGQDRAVAANLGGIGTLIGHELTHGFDDQGAQFDGDGNLVNWWQKDDLARFSERGTCVADQYSGFEVLPRKFIQGQLTLSENIADIAGAKLAFRAYRALRKDAAKTYVADGFSEDQQFFLAAAQGWCMRERPAETERRLTVDPHAPPKFRVFGSLRNFPEFAEAFRCPAGTPMRPARTCTVW
ncbi:MAG TPA: M13 family metallopeptidase [Kofleriaceae bacterium]|nr:M13 family metallopeptidase [Kofleriaceae bacterium]